MQYQTGISLKDLIRNGCTDEELTQAMKKVIWEKPVGHHFTSGNIEEDEMKLMSLIVAEGEIKKAVFVGEE